MIPSLEELDTYFPDLSIDWSYNQIDELYHVFREHFIDAPFSVDGLRVKVITKPSSIPEFDDYPETFTHLITRKSSSGHRVFDPFRANKIHWVKPILLQWDEPVVNFFRYEEATGIIRDYYWYSEGDFVVIMEQITPQYHVITSFNIDGEHTRRKFRKRYRNFRSERG